MESRRFKATATKTLSPYQLVPGDYQRINHVINLARDAIQAASKLTKSGCGIADTDYQAAFDFLVMSWVFLVLKKKGVSEDVLNRLRNLYQDNISIIVVNNIEGKCVRNIRLSLRQGDIPSMFFFAFGIDPLITYLDKRLSGILIMSLPVLGPVPHDSSSISLPPLEERYQVISYGDDLKPAITNMEEFSLDMVGVQLRATWSQHYQPLACWKVHVSHHKTLVCEHLRPIQSVVQVWVS